MTADEWKRQIEDWHAAFEFKTRPPIKRAEQPGNLSFPDDFGTLSEVTNGLRSDWFHLLPFHSPDDVKDTWDSLNRANDPTTTRFLGRDDELMKRFFIFAEIGGSHCACIDRKDGSIWFEDDEGLHQTDMDLREFVETTLREVAEL
jgi:hypothetical protein